MIKIIAIAKNTFVQNIRQPVFALVALTAIPAVMLCLALSVCRTMNADYRDADQWMMTNLALSTIQSIACVLAVICASATIDKEIKNRTALSVISKPTARWQFILGKFFGVGGAVALGFYIGVPIMFLAARYQVPSSASMDPDYPVLIFGIAAFFIAIFISTFGNILFGWNFLATTIFSIAVTYTIACVAVCFVSPDWGMAEFSDTFAKGKVHFRHLYGTVLMFYSVMILTAFAVAASTRIGPLGAMLGTLGFLMFGAMHEWFLSKIDVFIEDLALTGFTEQLGAFCRKIFDTVIPDFNIFEPFAKIAKGSDIPTEMIGFSGLYSLCYTIALIIVAIILFNRRELTESTSAPRSPKPISLAVKMLRLASIAILVITISIPSEGKNAMPFFVKGIITAVSAFIFFVTIAMEKKQKWSKWFAISSCAVCLLYCLAIMIMPEQTSIVQVKGFDTNSILICAMTVCAIILGCMFTRKAKIFFEQKGEFSINHS